MTSRGETYAIHNSSARSRCKVGGFAADQNLEDMGPAIVPDGHSWPIQISPHLSGRLPIFFAVIINSLTMARSFLLFTVLRRLDCVLETTKRAVLAEFKKRESSGVNVEPFLIKKAGQLFYNSSPLDLKKLMGDQDHIGENLGSYIQAFSPAVRDSSNNKEQFGASPDLSRPGMPISR